MHINGKNLIGFGESTGSGNTFRGYNPQTGETLPTDFYGASPKEVDQTLELASSAFRVFKNMAWGKRAGFLRAIADEMEDLGDALVERASAETGLPAARIIGERGRTTFQLRMFADHIEEGSWVDATIDTAQPDRKPLPKQDLRKMMVPLGPVVVFGASNFPLAYSVAGGDTAAALAAGCPVLVKAHPGHPGTSALVGRAVINAAKATGMPDGVFSLLYDNGFSVGSALVGHPATAAVGFTGSLTGGRALFDIAAQRESPIPVFAEMGSTNPVILLPAALRNRATEVADGYAGSITLGVGQFCTNPGLILGVKSAGLDKFADSLAGAIAASSPGTMLHSGISKAYQTNKSTIVAQQGVEIIGEASEEATVSQARPTVARASGQQFIANPRLHEEVFGPFSLLIECASAEELSQVVSSLNGQLTSTVIGEPEDFEDFGDLVTEIQEKAGRIIFNGVPTGVEVCPAMQHGGPYPATTDSRFTAVGVHSIKRFVRPVSFQNAPQTALPEPLQNANRRNIWRTIDGDLTKSSL
jgi:NADP-dependent aldehyde dehydrogenase